MKTHLLIFINLSLILHFIHGSANYDEFSALISIKASLFDPMNHLQNWQQKQSKNRVHCTWTGVYCNANGFIEKLDISNMTLSGNVSEEIQSLSSLSFLNLSCNGFTSNLPKSLSNLTSLVTIDVSQNNFFGVFPLGLGMAAKGLKEVNASSNNFSGFLPDDLGNATLLESLDFRGSYFEGSIPVSFKNLQKLKFLGLSGNNLSGKIPPEIGQLSSIETIIIGYNGFEGAIPVEIGNLTNLQYLDLAVGNLTGPIPSQLGELTKLTTLYLYKNSIDGKIPIEIGNLSSLVFLDLSVNRISGTIPEEIGGLKNLQLLNLMCNRLVGSVPDSIQELPKLEVLELWKNSFSGHLPINLGKNSPLKWLDVSSNSFSGEIPEGLCDSGNLTKLILFNNSFSGSLPLGLSICGSLVRVRVQNNRFSGKIPVGFGSLLQLQRLELANNNLTGEIPEDIGLSTSLSFIDLSWNQLDSSLPSNILSLPILQIFMASHNNLDGKIPNQFQDCPSLSQLDLSNNIFSGKIPESVASCEKLVNLNLQNNQFTGEIPKAMALMPSLAIIDLSNNSLTGRIPENFGTSPALEFLNLSYNKLEGPVPDNGVLMNINVNDLVGNPGLCGGVLPQCPQHFARTTASGLRLKNVHVSHAILGFIVGLLVLLCLGMSVFAGRWIYTKWYLYNTFCIDWFYSSSKGEWPWRLVAFQRLSFTSGDILACIKESNVIGMGGTGMVYKAEIVQRPPQHTTTVVAVKKLWRSSRPDVETGEDLLGEVNLLGRLRHRNVVRLLGYLHNEADVMMLYEYMPNGNLGEALHGGKMLLLDWVSRYNVAVGVAQGLHYLHHDCQPPVIHRDIKSNNILLDANLDARIADFGLARMMARKTMTVSMVAGSYGYIAPEYGYTLKVDEKIDIYSFGVVLLELLTGKPPLDPTFGESIDIVEWVRGNMRRNLAIEEALDSSIAGGECKHVQEEMLLVLRIALLCTAKLPKDRPSMRDVVTMLGEAKPRRKSICHNNANKEKPIFSTSPVVGLL